MDEPLGSYKLNIDVTFFDDGTGATGAITHNEVARQ